MLLGLVFLGYCQCHSWPYNPVCTYVADRSEAGRRPAASWNLTYHLAR